MSMDMESIFRTQVELQGRIARAGDNLKKAGSSKITSGVIEARIQNLDNYWRKFEANHDMLKTSFWKAIGEHEYTKTDFFGQVEETYLLQRGAFVDLLQTLRVKDSVDAGVVSQGASENHSRRSLPRIQLPYFSGAYDDWPSFRDLFCSLIDRDSAISKVEKLHYLRTSLKGEAELLVKNLPTTEDNYQRAWLMLTEHYENTRLLVRACFTKFITQSRMKNESASDLRLIFHNVLHTVGTLEALRRSITNCSDLFVHLVVEMLDSGSRREWETSISGTSEPPSCDTLKAFLECRLRTLEALHPGKLDSGEAASSKTSGSAKRSARTHLTQKQTSGKSRCSMCQQDHYILFCPDFQKKEPKEKKEFVETNQLCFNCFGNHRLSACQSKKSCAVCGKKHHSSIHDVCLKVETPAVASTSLHVQHQQGQRPIVLLATARVDVIDHVGTRHSTRALVDSGSEVSIVNEALVQRLRLPRTAATVNVYGVGGNKTTVARGRVSFKLYSRTSGFTMQVAALILPKISASASRIAMTAVSWPHIQGLQLADPEFHKADSVELLLGADVFAVIMEEGLRKGGPTVPIAQKTSLGWILSGTASITESCLPATSLQCRVEEELDTLVKQFWEQEELATCPLPLTEVERFCEEHYTRTHSRLSDGRYMVRLPMKNNMPMLNDSRRTAVRMQNNMERRFRTDLELKKLYTDFLKEYEDLGHMSPVTPAFQFQPKVCYLPHHGVLKQTDSSKKIRVVFNGSSQLVSGESLNNNLLLGPNLLPALPDVLLRWRMNKFAMVTDVEKMYRQIMVHPEDRNWQRILWRQEANEELQEYQLNTITYGLANAPFLAIRTMKQLAEDESHRFPRGAETLRRDVYVDDVLTGASTLEEAREIQRQLIALCSTGGFPLRKWMANCNELLASIPEDHRQKLDAHTWEIDASHSTLGLQWHPGKDTFSFLVHPVEKSPITKRSVLSQTARLFDPLGWLSPVIIGAKILIQSTWLQGLEWDQPLMQKDERTWCRIRDELSVLEQIRVPRWMDVGKHDEAEIHGFADASERAYAAVVYLRTQESTESFQSTLVLAKSKVAPTKQVSLPRLELCAAALAARLVRHVQVVTGLVNARITLWSDSTIALAWIRGHPSKWKTYVANRVALIHQTLPGVRWQHIPGKDNPADCASRGLSPKELLDHQLWWHGPPWLRACNLPHKSIEDPEHVPEQRTRTLVTLAEPAEDDMLLRFSQLERLLRVTAWCRRWLGARSSQQSVFVLGNTLASQELEKSKQAWIRATQRIWFAEELKAITAEQPVRNRSPLVKLNPVLDEQGILRVGGRLKHSVLNYDQQHPVILPRSSHFSALIIDACHRHSMEAYSLLWGLSVNSTGFLEAGQA